MSNHRRLVLVVEDEVLLRMSVVDALQSEGFEVIGLANGDDALRVIQNRPDVRAIFTDINMPGKIDGLGLVKCVEQTHPGIAIFVASGKQIPSVLGELPPRAKFYPKPYVMSELVKAIKASTG